MHALLDAGYAPARNSELTEFERLVGGLAFLLGLDAGAVAPPGEVVGDLRQRLRVSERLCEVLRERFGMRVAPHELALVGDVNAQVVDGVVREVVARAHGDPPPPVAVAAAVAAGEGGRGRPGTTWTWGDDSVLLDSEEEEDWSSSEEDTSESQDGEAPPGKLDEDPELAARVLREANARVEVLLTERREAVAEALQLDTRLKGLRINSTNPHGRAIAGLLRTNERLKRQEKDFKASCRAEMVRLQGRIEAYDETARQTPPRDSSLDAAAELQRLEGEVRDKRKRLAWATRAAVEARKVHELETFPERTQYELRFHELSEQAAAKTDVHKDLVAKFNMLTTQLALLEREVALLETVNSALDQGKIVQATSFGEVLESLHASAAGVESRIAAHVRAQREEEDELARLLERQREYSRKLKELLRRSEGGRG